MGIKWSLIIFQLYMLVNMVYPEVSWEVVGEGFQYVAVGPQGVYALKPNGSVYYRVGTVDYPGALGSDWQDVGGGLSQLDVGTRVLWGVNAKSQVWRKDYDENNVASTWGRMTDQYLKHISVSDKNHMWGIYPSGTTRRRKGANLETPWGNDWEAIRDRFLSKLTVGSGGVWAITEGNKVVYREGTYGDINTAGSGWTEVPGDMKCLSSDAGTVYGISSDDKIYYRNGTAENQPTGTEWVQVEGSLKQIDSYNGSLWGVNSHNQVLAKVLGCF